MDVQFEIGVPEPGPGFVRHVKASQLVRLIDQRLLPPSRDEHSQEVLVALSSLNIKKNGDFHCFAALHRYDATARATLSAYGPYVIELHNEINLDVVVFNGDMQNLAINLQKGTISPNNIQTWAPQSQQCLNTWIDSTGIRGTYCEARVWGQVCLSDIRRIWISPAPPGISSGTNLSTVRDALQMEAAFER